MYINAVRDGHRKLGNFHILATLLNSADWSMVAISAEELFKRCRHTVPSFYRDHVDELGLVKTPVQVLSSSLAKTLSGNEFTIKLSREAVRILEGCMKKSPNCAEVINEHVNIEVSDSATTAIMDDFGGLLGQASTSGMSKFHLNISAKRFPNR